MKIYYFGELIAADVSEELTHSELTNRIEKFDLSSGSVSEDTVTGENHTSRSDRSSDEASLSDALAVNGVKVEKQTDNEERQLTLEFENKTEQKKIGMPSVGDLLNDIDLSIDVYRPRRQMQGA